MKNGMHANITKSGKKEIPYLRVSAGPQRGKYVHRMIAEALLRRRLKPNETVDHKNQDSRDCDPTNIMVLSWVDHAIVTNGRTHQKHLVEGVDYFVILDGEKVFEEGGNDDVQRSEECSDGEAFSSSGGAR